MFTSSLLSFREGLEAALIIGILLSTVQKLGRPELKTQIWLGAALSVIICSIAGWFLIRYHLELEGRNEQIFEGATLLLTAGFLTWMIRWMADTAPNMGKELQDKVTEVISGNGIFAIALIAIIRECLELVLFLAAISTSQDPNQTILGSMIGLVLASLLGWALFTSTVKLNISAFFKVTNVLLIILAAGMVGLGIHELNDAGIIPALIEPVWNINGLVNENSVFGQLLQSLVGYNGDPSLSEVFGYVLFLGGIFISSRKLAKAK